MRRTATALILMGTLLAGAACAPDTNDDDEPKGSGKSKAGKDAKSVSFTLNWTPYGEHAPFYYGLDKGFYADEGIDLKINPGKGSADTVQHVAQGNIDFGWADTPALLNGVNEGMAIKSLGVFLQKGPASIEFLSDAGIEEPADLEGKEIGGTPGDAMYATFPAWLKANDVDPAKVKVVNVPPDQKISQLAAGKVDAIMGFFHDQGPTIENITKKEVDYLLYSEYGMNVLGTGIIANDKMIKDDPELVKAFVRATAKSWEEAAKNQEEAVKIMAAEATKPPPEEVLLKQLADTLPLLEADAGGVGVNAEEKWQETLDLLKEGEMLKKADAPSAYWDSSFAAKG